MPVTEAILFEDAVQPALDEISLQVREEALPVEEGLARMTAGALDAMIATPLDGWRHSASQRAGRAISGVLYQMLTDENSGVAVRDLELLRGEQLPKGPDTSVYSRYQFRRQTAIYALSYALSAYNVAGADRRHSFAKQYGIDR